MAFQEKFDSLRKDFEQHPWKMIWHWLGKAFSGFAMFCWRVMLASGVVCFGYLSLLPADMEVVVGSMRGASFLTGFAAIFCWLCFGTATKMLIKQNRK